MQFPVYGADGSPPRVWGKRQLLDLQRSLHRFTPTRVGKTYCLVLADDLQPLRFTPTRVGKTCRRRRKRPSASVHPHACGENSIFANSAAATSGSPPRVWGKLVPLRAPTRLRRFTPTRVGKTERRVDGVVIRDRFTPTRVGKTPADPGTIPSPPVHPHACGENIAVFPTVGPSDGSPPRVWGKRGTLLDCRGCPRFTPTRVGKTLCASFQNPRVRGSPPRVWGKHSDISFLVSPIRFTPTRVGKTAEVLPMVRFSAVHPHACGENPIAAPHSVRRSGSPPRVWGKRMSRRNGPPLKPVHPHACGENAGTHSISLGQLGSPPRVWGKRDMFL